MIIYYIKETFNSLSQSKLGSLLVIITTAIAISFVTLSAGLVIFSNIINNELKENIRINLFVSDTLENSSYHIIENELKLNSNVDSYKLIDKEEALRNMKEKTGEDFFSVLEHNPLPASYSVRLVADSVSRESIESIISSLAKLKGIDDVVYDYNLTLKVLSFINSSKKIIYAASLFLVVLSIYLVYSNNKLLLSSRINHYNTMKLVGAKLKTIKLPIFLTGIIMGLIASLLCIGSFYIVFQFLLKLYMIYIPEINLLYSAIIILILGMIFGFLGSYLATLNVTLRIHKLK